MDCAPVPEVPARPEIPRIVSDIGLGNTSADEGYKRLRSIVEEYLDDNASLDRGKLVGLLLALALYPPTKRATSSVGAAKVYINPDQARIAKAAITDAWQRAARGKPSPLAADRGVQMVLAEVLVKSSDAGIEEGFDRLQEQKLKYVFPPGVL